LSSQPHDIQCSCPAGDFGVFCKHAAVVSFARKYGLRPLRPTVQDSPPAPQSAGSQDHSDPLWDAFN
jgi:hypothetical protein